MAIVQDDNWVTINGHHVLIKEKANVSKATPNMVGGKFSNPKEEEKKVKAEMKATTKAHSRRVGNMFKRRYKELDEIDEKINKLDKDWEKQNNWKYGDASWRLRRLNKEKYGDLAERVRNKGKSKERSYLEQESALQKEKRRVNNEHDYRLDKAREQYVKKQEEGYASRKKLQRKVEAARATLSAYRASKKKK